MYSTDATVNMPIQESLVLGTRLRAVAAVIPARMMNSKAITHQ
jgi:hypothetical protein